MTAIASKARPKRRPCSKCHGTGTTVYRHRHGGYCYTCGGYGTVRGIPPRKPKAEVEVPASVTGSLPDDWCTCLITSESCDGSCGSVA